MAALHWPGVEQKPLALIALGKVLKILAWKGIAGIWLKPERTRQNIHSKTFTPERLELAVLLTGCKALWESLFHQWLRQLLERLLAPPPELQLVQRER